MTARSTLSISEVVRIASEAAQAASPTFTVIGVTATGGSGYSEILVVNVGCDAEPCHCALGVFRDNSEAALKAEILDTLRRQLARGHEIPPLGGKGSSVGAG
jgi:hypothetical protein